MLAPCLKETPAYFAGGTALSLVYFQHRRSRDFDFMVAPEHVEVIRPLWAILMARAAQNGFSVEEMRWPIHGWATGHFNGVKVDVAVDPVGCHGPFNFLDGVAVAPLEEILKLKWGAVAGRMEMHDLYDLHIADARHHDIWALLTDAVKDAGTDLRIPVLGNIKFWIDEHDQGRWKEPPAWLTEMEEKWNAARFRIFLDFCREKLADETLLSNCLTAE